jgi:transposase
MRKDVVVEVSAADLARLDAIVADRNSPQKHVWRARIVLLTAAELGTVEIMRRIGKSKTCVWRWQERFMQEGVAGLRRDKTRPSRIPPLGAQIAARVVALTQEDPPGETTHWTAGMMARTAGISVSSVQRIWRAHGLQPHRVRQFKLSTDPQFVTKLRDIVGLYVDPPAHAIVLSVDEKSQIQALDRTQPGLPLKRGRAGTMTHDYKRNGTTTLFAALDVLDGKVIGPACSAIGTRNSSASSMPSRPRSRPAGSSTSSSTITARTSIPRPEPGSIGIPASCSTTRRPQGPGLTPSRASSPS